MDSSQGDQEPSLEETESKEVRTLREVMLRARRDGEEPQVADDQLRANDQLQQDEMLALEAIYGEKIGIFGEIAGSRCFQIHVHCEIPGGISVSAEPFQGVDDATDSLIHTFNVQYLAPISLTCLMPPSYPSHHPPYFTLSVQWLGWEKVSSLCQMLDSIWVQQPGQEVVYEWVQWLQSTALSHLGYDDRIVIRQPECAMNPTDVRAVVQIMPLESVIQWLVSYNEEQCHEIFISGLHDCLICLSEYAGIDFIKLPCLHYYCRRCMESYSRMHVKEGTVQKLLCPHDKCKVVIPSNLLKRLLGDADFERWERLILQKTLDAMVDVTYCPRCQTACLEDEENNAQCSKCFFSFCTRCRERRHIGDKCMTPEEKLLSLQNREKARPASISKGINLVHELYSIKEILRDSVQCPHCRTAISRVSGCDHMVCRNCGTPFCYGCGKATDRNHTSEQCRLDQEQRVVRQRDVVKKIGNNNHIFCWACQVHYCALCAKVVRKCSEHYGPRGCKQHTVDPEIAPVKKDDDLDQKFGTLKLI
ncbi:hypothetical protein EJB05_39485 [Eragrostis curvula]|uniref:RBR-type E3 ubiquitin transferase n=1 Tax=Eragrostis curvula TaxID=38414 RepID=A0A5J9TZ18_9POAL|nr:hypothetical protein EJB05_39485 [Eragrostis curvula]